MKLTDWLSKSLSISLLALVAVCTGAVPGLLGKQPFLSLELAVAQQPSVDPQEITNYARALLEIEPLRSRALDEIKPMVGSGDVPKINCSDPQSMSGLPSSARDIATNFCNSSQKIVEKNGFTIDRFNAITVTVQNSRDLKKQVYNELLRLNPR